MIYLKNNTETQAIYIPRKTVLGGGYIATTKTYEDGYRDGLEDGKEQQKDKLLNLYVTENGQYEREDGWGVVTVDTPDCSDAYNKGYEDGYNQGQAECPDCPEGGSCNLGEGEFVFRTSDVGRYELNASDDGYDGWSKIYLEIEGSAIRVWRASELLNMHNNGETLDYGRNYYVGGEITEIIEVNTQYGNATYILDNGFKIYRGKWIDGNRFISEDQIKVGAYIVVYGVLAEYNGTLQLNKNSQVIAYQECTGGSCNLGAGVKEISENGSYNYSASDDGFDGYSSIEVRVNVPQSGEGGGCNLEDKSVTPSMSDRDVNGLIVVNPSEGYDGLSRTVIDPQTIYNEGVEAGRAEGGEGGSCNLINPIVFSETEGNTINAGSIQIPTFVYEGNQYYNVGVLNMPDYEEFKIQIRFQPNNRGDAEPINVFGCEDTDWDNTTFGARIYQGQIYFRMSGQDVVSPYTENTWYDVEMGYNTTKRWVIVNRETLLETEHTSFNKPSQSIMIGAINSGGNAFRPFYGKIAATYLEANGNQVWLLPKNEGYMDVYWNDRGLPWIQLNGENNARFENDYISGDGMKSITWLGKRATCPSAQEQTFDYDITAFTYKVYDWTSVNINRDNITNDCGDRPLDCLLFRNRSGECTVMTKLDTCSGVVRLENGWNGDSIILSLKSNSITKFSNNSINSNQLKSIDTGFAYLEGDAIMNCNALTDIKVTVNNNDLSKQFATNCFNGLPAEGTIAIGKNAGVTLTDDEITSFFRTIVGEGWTITIK